MQPSDIPVRQQLEIERNAAPGGAYPPDRHLVRRLTAHHVVADRLAERREQRRLGRDLKPRGRLGGGAACEPGQHPQRRKQAEQMTTSLDDAHPYLATSSFPATWRADRV